MVLLSFKGLAVGALVERRVCFVGADLDLIQCAVVIAAAMVLALEHGAFDALVGVLVIIHGFILLRSGYK